jgi:hypothetical protein
MLYYTGRQCTENRPVSVLNFRQINHPKVLTAKAAKKCREVAKENPVASPDEQATESF